MDRFPKGVDTISLAVASLGIVSCDIEQVVERDNALWFSMLGEHGFIIAKEITQHLSEEIGTSATRLWSALECLKKAGIPMDTPFVYKPCDEEGWSVLKAGRFIIPTYVARVRKVDLPLALAILTVE